MNAPHLSTQLPFNFILSDGLHAPKVLAAEMGALLSHGLLASGAEGRAEQRVLVAWDDCGEGGNDRLRRAVEGPLRSQFLKAGLGPQVCWTRVLFNGWVGTSEHQHGCCLLSTFDLREWFTHERAAPPSSTTPAAEAARALFASARESLVCMPTAAAGTAASKAAVAPKGVKGNKGKGHGKAKGNKSPKRVPSWLG